VLVIRGGLLEGELVGDEEIRRLATLPAADVLRAQLASSVAAPLTTVVGLFAAPLRELVGVLDARIHQLENETRAEPSASGRGLHADSDTSKPEEREEHDGEG